MYRKSATLHRLFIACVVSAAIAGCASGPSSEDEEIRLLETDREFAARSVSSTPAEAFAEYLAEDALQLPNGSEPIFGRDEIVRSMVDGPGFELNWEPQRAEVSASTDMGWTWGTYVATFQDSTGADIQSTGKYLNVWRKQADGIWRVVVDMGNNP